MDNVSPPAGDGTGNRFPHQGALAGLIAGAMAGMAPAPAPHPDAALLDLVEEFLCATKAAARMRGLTFSLGARLSRDERVLDGDARHAEAMQATLVHSRDASHIARRAAALPATTPAGLIAKAQICRASVSGCPKLARSLAEDLIASPELRRAIFPAEVI